MYFFRKIVIFYLFLIVSQSLAQEWVLSEVKESAKILALGAVTNIALCQLIGRGFLRKEYISSKVKNEIKEQLKDYKHYLWNHTVFEGLFVLPVVLSARYGGKIEKLNYSHFMVPAMTGIGLTTLFVLKRVDTRSKLFTEDKISRQEMQEKWETDYLVSNYLVSKCFFLLGLCGWALYKRNIFKNLL